MGIQLGTRLRAECAKSQLGARERRPFLTFRLPARAPADPPPNTVMIEYKATDKDPAQAVRTADAVADSVTSFVQNTPEKTQIGATTSLVSVVWDAILPTSPYGRTRRAEMERP